MMKIINLFRIAGLLLIAAQTLSAQRIAIPEMPIKEGGYVEYDLGDFLKGKKKQLILRIKNEGYKDLEIKNIELSCDCISYKKKLKKIGPGAVTTLKITHDAKHSGDFSVFAKLSSNAENYPELWIKLSGNVMWKTRD